MSDPVRIGFIGCGGNARGHMKRLTSLENAHLVAVCDVVPELAQRAAAETGAQAYTDHQQMLSRDDLQAVYVSIPVFAHGQPERDVIARGLPFLVEKPVAISMEVARDLEARIREAGLLTAVGYQLRYSRTVDLAQAELEGKRLGLVMGRYWCNSGAAQPTRWLQQMAKSGGQLVEQATHTIDMMRNLGGEVTEVYCASTNQVLKHIDCPDFNAVTLKFANGAVGTLTAAWAYEQGWGNTNVVDILYENQRLCWTFGKLTIWKDQEAHEQEASGPSIDEVFIEAVQTGDQSLIRSPYAEGVKSLAISLAMNESARRGAPVTIAEMG